MSLWLVYTLTILSNTLHQGSPSWFHHSDSTVFFFLMASMTQTKLGRGGTDPWIFYQAPSRIRTNVRSRVSISSPLLWFFLHHIRCSLISVLQKTLSNLFIAPPAVEKRQLEAEYCSHLLQVEERCVHCVLIPWRTVLSHRLYGSHISWSYTIELM